MEGVAICDYCHNIQEWKKFNAPKDYLACIEYIQQLVTNGDFELLEEESTCPLNQVETEDGWADEIMVHMVRCKHCGQVKSLPVLSTLIVVVVLSKRVKVDKVRLLIKMVSGHFCPVVRRGTRTGAFISALSADETSPALAAPRHAITALFSCRFKCPCPPPAATAFSQQRRQSV